MPDTPEPDSGPAYLTMTEAQAASDRATVQGYDTPHRHPAWAMVERWVAEYDAQQVRAARRAKLDLAHMTRLLELVPDHD